MRILEYLSPTSLMDWESNPEKFYLTRLADNRLPRDGQTQAMSIGSAVDARWKNYLAERLLDPGQIADPQGDQPAGQFHLKTIFDGQVEEQWRDWAWTNSGYLMKCYVESGAMSDLMLELTQGSDWRFEFTLRGTLDAKDDEGVDVAVPLLGKPDCYYKNNIGVGIIYDLKVNGYCSRSKVSPTTGYVCRRSQDARGKWTRLGEHKNALVQEYKGLRINAMSPIDVTNAHWATQLSTYAWMMGEDVGGDFVCGIEQFACGPPPLGHPMNQVEVVSLRGRISELFQRNLAQRYARAWRCISEGRIFPDLSVEENRGKLKALDDILQDPRSRMLAKC